MKSRNELHKHVRKFVHFDLKHYDNKDIALVCLLSRRDLNDTLQLLSKIVLTKLIF